MPTPSSGWRLVARIAAYTWLAWAVIITVLSGGLEPFVLIFAGVPLLSWAATLWKPGRTTFTIFGVLGLAVILLNFPAIPGDLSHPESALGFTFTLIPILAALLMITVGISAWAKLSDRAASVTWMTAGAIFVVGLVVSIVAALGLEDDVAQDGDLRLAAKDTEWSTSSLSGSGDVAVFVENQDPYRHTFTIEALGIQVELPARTARRIEVDAPPGTYTYHCTVSFHEDMTGTITVGG